MDFGSYNNFFLLISIQTNISSCLTFYILCFKTRTRYAIYVLLIINKCGYDDSYKMYRGKIVKEDNEIIVYQTVR